MPLEDCVWEKRDRDGQIYQCVLIAARLVPETLVELIEGLAEDVEFDVNVKMLSGEEHLLKVKKEHVYVREDGSLLIKKPKSEGVGGCTNSLRST